MINTNKANRTQRDIRNALVSLLLKKDFDEISVIDICESAMITRATFYKYFEDKFHLVSCVIDDYKNMIVEDKLKNYEYNSPQELFEYIAKICLDLIEENQKALAIIYSHCKKQKLNEQILGIIDANIVEILEKQKEQGEMFEVPIKIMSKFFSGGLMLLALAYLENPKSIKRKDIEKFLQIQLINSSLIKKR